MSAGVARQYTGTAGRVENCQVGVFLAYAAPDGGRALIDRELYLPKKWTDDRDRCRAAGIGDDVAFATKPELAQAHDRARGAGGRPVRVGGRRTRSTAATPELRDWLEEAGIRYVMAVACSETVTAPRAGRARRRAGRPGPGGRWQRLSCADGSKGPRLYDWALIGHGPRTGTGCSSAGPCARARRASLSWPSSAAGHPARSPSPSSPPCAGARWGVEDCFAEAKNETGLDHYQVRRYHAWYRHVTLSMLAARVPRRHRARRPPGIPAPPAARRRRPG